MTLDALTNHLRKLVLAVVIIMLAGCDRSIPGQANGKATSTPPAVGQDRKPAVSDSLSTKFAATKEALASARHDESALADERRDLVERLRSRLVELGIPSGHPILADLEKTDALVALCLGKIQDAELNIAQVRARRQALELRLADAEIACSQADRGISPGTIKSVESAIHEETAPPTSSEDILNEAAALDHNHAAEQAQAQRRAAEPERPGHEFQQQPDVDREQSTTAMAGAESAEAAFHEVQVHAGSTALTPDSTSGTEAALNSTPALSPASTPRMQDTASNAGYTAVTSSYTVETGDATRRLANQTQVVGTIMSPAPPRLVTGISPSPVPNPSPRVISQRVWVWHSAPQVSAPPVVRIVPVRPFANPSWFCNRLPVLSAPVRTMMYPPVPRCAVQQQRYTTNGLQAHSRAR